MKYFIFSFHVLCVLATIVMIAYGVYKFWLNEDTTVIVFNRFNGNGIDIYPTLSFCFKGKGVFDTERIKNETKSETDYRKFLDGKVWDNKLLVLDYDNVSCNAEKMLDYLYIKSSNGSSLVKIYEWKNEASPKKEGVTNNFPFKVSLRSPKAKCYSFDINGDNVANLKNFDVAAIELKLRGYYQGVQHYEKHGKSPSLHLSVFLTYPQQLMRSFPIIKLGNLHKQRNDYKIKILTQGIEVLERRSKRDDVCKPSWWNDDSEILQHLSKNVGCRHNYWPSNLHNSVCNSQEQFMLSSLPDVTIVDAGFLKDYVPPCREIQTVLSSNTVEIDTNSNNQTKNGPFTNLKIQFKSNVYKLIKNVRAFNEESLIGNLGGYVGLFLGVAIWQAPSFAEDFVKAVKNLKQSKPDKGITKVQPLNYDVLKQN